MKKYNLFKVYSEVKKKIESLSIEFVIIVVVVFVMVVAIVVESISIK
jgi:hypothetical protein